MSEDEHSIHHHCEQPAPEQSMATVEGSPSTNSSALKTTQPPLVGTFSGKQGPLFELSLRTGAYTIATLGVYRFWAKTRLRRWHWSAIRIGGLPLEYVGDPIEKLLGFFIAVVILAFYIGVVNLLLMFASFSLFQGNTYAYAASLIGVVPIWFYARYRARRYILARTRWRGLRFGLEKGAWGYAWRALLFWLLTLVSCGFLWPLMTFQLEKYRTNRTSYGTACMEQGGSWTMLYPATSWIFAATLMGAVGYGASLSNSETMATILLTLSFVLFLYGAAYFRAKTLETLTTHKSLGGLSVSLSLKPFHLLWIYVSGYCAAATVSFFPFIAVVASFTIYHLQVGTAPEKLDEAFVIMFSWVPMTVQIVVSALFYFTIFLVWNAMREIWVTRRLHRLYAHNLVIYGAEHLKHIKQRPRDEHIEAEGFAEALDVGASI